MTALMRAELINLRTLRSAWITPISVIVLAAIIAAGAMSDAGSDGLTTPAELREPLMAGAGIIAAVVLSIFAALRVASQYRYRTIANRVLASPRRGRILASELLTYTGFALVVGAIALGVAFAVAAPIVAGKDLSLGLTAGLLVRAVFAVAVFAVIGVAVGVITRSQPTAIAVIVGTFVVEKIVAGLVDGVGQYLPYELLNRLIGIGNSPLSPGVAAVVLAAIAAALAAAASILLGRRDIT